MAKIYIVIFTLEPLFENDFQHRWTPSILLLYSYPLCFHQQQHLVLCYVHIVHFNAHVKRQGSQSHLHVTFNQPCLSWPSRIVNPNVEREALKRMVNIEAAYVLLIQIGLRMASE